MKCGKLTAKLRDAVPVCFLENDREVMRYKNIEIPNSLKSLEFSGFRFDVPSNGVAITFKIMFAEGVLPTVWPEARSRKHHGAKTEETGEEAGTMEKEPESAAILEKPETNDEPIQEGQALAQPAEIQNTEQEPSKEQMNLNYYVISDRRKALVDNISIFLGMDAVYLRAPSYGYRIGEYTVSREGTVTGPVNQSMVEFLESQGYKAVP